MPTNERDNPVVPESIPHPGRCAPDGSLTWICDRCEESHPISREHCFNCGEERQPILDPWVKLAERVFQITASIRIPAHPENRPHTAAFRRFILAMKMPYEAWEENEHYDLAAVAQMEEWERRQLLDILCSADATWREVELMDAVDLPQCISLLRQATHHHLSSATRLTAAAALHRRGLLDKPIGAAIDREIRLLDRFDAAATRVLDLAKTYPTDDVKQALLYGSYCTTASASHCAELLCNLCGTSASPDFLKRIDMHNSYFTRKAAFDELCAMIGMQLDTSRQ